MPAPVALVLALIAIALISRWRWPIGRCWSCRGSGTNGGSNGRRWGICRRCGGSGQRRRIGARRQ